VTDANLLLLARRLHLLTWLNLSEAQQLTAEGLGAALPLLSSLAQLDLTCCWQLRDDHLLSMLDCSSPAGTADGCGASHAAGPPSPLTPANVQLPQGATSPTGSPFRRRARPW
jgi:hypothetical protein